MLPGTLCPGIGLDESKGRFVSSGKRAGLWRIQPPTWPAWRFCPQWDGGPWSSELLGKCYVCLASVPPALGTFCLLVEEGWR